MRTILFFDMFDSFLILQAGSSVIEFGHTCWAGASTAVDEREKAFHGAYLMQRALVTKVCKSDSARSKFSTTKKGSQSDSARSNMFAIIFL